MKFQRLAASLFSLFPRSNKQNKKTKKKTREREREREREWKQNRTEKERERERKKPVNYTPPIEDVGTDAIICLKLPPSTTAAGSISRTISETLIVPRNRGRFSEFSTSPYLTETLHWCTRTWPPFHAQHRDSSCSQISTKITNRARVTSGTRPFLFFSLSLSFLPSLFSP